MNTTTATPVAADERRQSLGAPALVTFYGSLVTLAHAITEMRSHALPVAAPIFLPSPVSHATAQHAIAEIPIGFSSPNRKESAAFAKIRELSLDGIGNSNV